MCNVFEDILVSVIIPSYGGAIQLKRAVESVLKQTHTNIEVFVVDDNPPDSVGRKNTELIMSCFNDNRLNYVKHKKNMNGAAARNTGISLSKGKYICFLDDDDFYFPDRVELSVATMEKNKDCDCVLCGVMDCTDSGLYGVRYHYNQGGSLKKELLTRKIIMGTGSNIFVTAKAIKDLGGFDTSFQRLQDDEFMVRFYRKYKACVCDQLLIIKSRNGINNEPPLEKLYKSRDLFFNKFKDDIKELDKNEKNMFYNFHFTALFHAACYSKESKLKNYVVSELKKIRQLTKKEKMQLALLQHKAGQNIISVYSSINLIGKIKEKKLSNKIKNSCTLEEQKYIDYQLRGDNI